MATTLIPLSSIEGVNFNTTYIAYDQTAAISATNSPDNPGPPFQVGTVVKSTGGGEFIFVKASAALAVGDAAIITSSTGAATGLTTTNAGTSEGRQIGFAQVAIASGSYGWLQRDGACQNISVAASCAQDVPLYTTATAGVLDDAATTLILGVVITTTVTAAAVTPGTINRPYAPIA
jgi:hypothetical protein